MFFLPNLLPCVCIDCLFYVGGLGGLGTACTFFFFQFWFFCCFYISCSVFNFLLSFCACLLFAATELIHVVIFHKLTMTFCVSFPFSPLLNTLSPSSPNSLQGLLLGDSNDLENIFSWHVGDLRRWLCVWRGRMNGEALLIRERCYSTLESPQPLPCKLPVFYPIWRTACRHFLLCTLVRWITCSLGAFYVSCHLEPFLDGICLWFIAISVISTVCGEFEKSHGADCDGPIHRITSLWISQMLGMDYNETCFVYDGGFVDRSRGDHLLWPSEGLLGNSPNSP